MSTHQDIAVAGRWLATRRIGIPSRTCARRGRPGSASQRPCRQRSGAAGSGWRDISFAPTGDTAPGTTFHPPSVSAYGHHRAQPMTQRSVPGKSERADKHSFGQQLVLRWTQIAAVVPCHPRYGDCITRPGNRSLASPRRTAAGRNPVETAAGGCHPQPASVLP